MSHCTVTCLIAFVIVVAMVIMNIMVMNDPFIQSYKSQLPEDIKKHYDDIVAERSRIFFTGYLIGFVLSVFVIIFNVNVLKQKMPVAAMVCLAVVVSTVVNYFYYILSPKSNYMVDLLKTEKQRQDWLQIYKSMQYYYHGSFVLGAVAVGVFAYAFRGSCR